MIVLLTALSLSAVPAIAQDDQQATPQPAVQAAPASADNIAVIVSVKGRVSYKIDGEGDPIVARVSQVLPPGAVVTTGLRSAVQIRVGKTQVFTIDRMANVALAEMVKSTHTGNGADRTTLDVEYGRVLFNVTSTEFANDVTIRAPDATLAIKGTEGGLEVTPGQPTRGFGGEFNRGRIELSFKKGGKATINNNADADANTPAAGSSVTRRAGSPPPRPACR